MATKKTSTGTGRTKPKTTRKTVSIDDIRMKAEELYLERVARGEPGRAEDDWLKAEEQLKGNKQ
ncbi:MAG TPA: hypothetical protein VE870_08815 [Bacteroidales bacterium]|nr:hypothetical protein [Bacteroidales bacterium]